MCSMQALVERAEQVAGATTPEGRLLRLGELRRAVDAAMVATLAEVEAAPGPMLLDGAVDAGDWMASRTELHPAEARSLVGLAEDLPTMPATAAALDAARIGVEKARLLRSAREVDGFADAEADLVDRVVGVSLRTARRVIARFVADHRTPSEPDDSANEVTLSPRRNGRWRLAGDLDVATATLIANELRRLADAHRDDDLSRPRRTAMALVDACRRSVTLGERGPGSRPELVLVADVGIHGDVSDTRLEDGTPVGREVFEALTCDATIRGLLVNGPSEVLDLGRSQRLASQGQRRAVAVRDGGCVYPGCDRPPDECELHHIRHWLEHDGATDLANLCLLCRHHHRLAHTLRFTFVLRPRDGLTIVHADGTPFTWPRQRAA